MKNITFLLEYNTSSTLVYCIQVHIISTNFTEYFIQYYFTGYILYKVFFIYFFQHHKKNHLKKKLEKKNYSRKPLNYMITMLIYITEFV